MGKTAFVLTKITKKRLKATTVMAELEFPSDSIVKVDHSFIHQIFITKLSTCRLIGSGFTAF